VPDISFTSQPIRVAVVGGGVSGLAAAHRLRRLLPRAELRLFEASDRLGGPLHTVRARGALLEQGADSFLIKTPWALELCRELGLADQLMPTNEQHRRALVLRKGKLLPVPDGFVLMRAHNLGAVLRSPVLSAAGKLRLLTEPLVPAPAGVRAPDFDESVASFATRRLGREAFQRLVQPLVAGIFVADAERLSLAATFPEFLTAEREHGSLWRSVRAAGQQSTDAKPQAAAARYGQFVTLRRGMGALVEALADSLPQDSIRLRERVEHVAPGANDKWMATLADRAEPEVFDGVVLATHPPQTARLVEPFDKPLSDDLRRIDYASSVVVTLEYPRERIAHPMDGFGAVVPAIENRPVIAASFLTVKFPHTAPKDRAIIRVFMGGVLRPELVDRSDDELIGIAKQELADWLGAQGPPCSTHVTRWLESMPQYHVGHVGLVAAIENRVSAHRGLELAGGGYRGVGVPQCVRSGQEAAERLAKDLSALRAPR